MHQSSLKTEFKIDYFFVRIKITNFTIKHAKIIPNGSVAESVIKWLRADWSAGVHWIVNKTTAASNNAEQKPKSVIRESKSIILYVLNLYSLQLIYYHELIEEQRERFSMMFHVDFYFHSFLTKSYKSKSSLKYK